MPNITVVDDRKYPLWKELFCNFMKISGIEFNAIVSGINNSTQYDEIGMSA